MGLKQLLEWFRLEDYEAAKSEATEQAITRYTRGNVSMQNGAYLDEEALCELSREGDRAIISVEKMIPK